MILQYPLPSYPRGYSAAFLSTPVEHICDTIETWRRQLPREALSAPLEPWAMRFLGFRLTDIERLMRNAPLAEEFADTEVRARQFLARVTGVREFGETAITIVSTSDSGRFDVALVPAPTWSAEYRSGPLISSAYVDRPSRRKALAPPRRD